MRAEVLVEVEWPFEDGDTDWKYCKKRATFQHKDRDACEFIIHIGDVLPNGGKRHFELVLEEMKKAKCSKGFMKTYEDAAKLGAKKVLFYT